MTRTYQQQMSETMTTERWMAITNGNPMTDDELRDGWHFCVDWDDLLIGPGMGELRCCQCACAAHVERPGYMEESFSVTEPY